MTTEPRAAARGAGRAALLVALLGALSLGLAACRQDMHDAPRYEPLEKSDFFADGQASRPPVPGTVGRRAIGEVFREDPVFLTGLGADGQPVASLPVALEPRLLARGRERFDIFCSPCHGRVGAGEGMIVRRGYKKPQTFHSDRLRQVPVGYFVDAMTRGFGQMPSYAGQISPTDRWAIAAYLRALQLSQNAPAAALPEADRGALAALSAGAEASPGPGREPGTASHGQAGEGN